jgi:hypothetical protein
MALRLPVGDLLGALLDVPRAILQEQKYRELLFVSKL